MQQSAQVRVTGIVPQQGDASKVLMEFNRPSGNFGALIPTSANVQVGDIVALYNDTGNFFNGNKAIQVILPVEGEVIYL